MWASSIKARHELVEAFIEAAGTHGLPRVQDFNTGDHEGVGYYQLTTRNGLRCSSAVAYLKRARRRPNLTVMTGTQAARILFDGKRACGVRAGQPGALRTLRARCEVLLAAGALQSPQLLQLSGIGPLAIGINQGALFCKVTPEAMRPDIQFHFATLSADMAGGKVHPFPGCTYSVCQLRPDSRGHVRIRSTDPFEAPSMQPYYLSAELDRRTAVAAVRYARRLASSDPLAPLMKREVRPGADAQSDDEILHFCREYGATIFHPSGTAKMGPDDDTMAVVDSRLRVRGVSGLRVVDCSVMPTLVSGNTNVPIIMVAEKASDLILEDARR